MSFREWLIGVVVGDVPMRQDAYLRVRTQKGIHVVSAYEVDPPSGLHQQGTQVMIIDDPATLIDEPEEISS